MDQLLVCVTWWVPGNVSCGEVACKKGEVATDVSAQCVQIVFICAHERQLDGSRHQDSSC